MLVDLILEDLKYSIPQLMARVDELQRSMEAAESDASAARFEYEQNATRLSQYQALRDRLMIEDAEAAEAAANA